jgi:lysozyme
VNDFDRFFAQLKRHEGFRRTPYQCSTGHWTIGYGHKLRDPSDLRQEIGEELAEIVLRWDIDDAQAAMWDFPIPSGCGLPRVYALTNMCFNLGKEGLRKFKRMWAAFARGDWETAAKEALDSKWAREDVGHRAVELAEQLRTGRW